ncbi:hypothetical protein M2401_000799 [Pseudomonas sp. JUb42]|uniref:DUF4376 domain-containing protein n=1 Tax=Pseudomonas sp. JUb42 TaxID=2940611 RepID=UPI0021674E01|nr:DUF4376 domain-containing protein [Pseudomonas sp. JUb42]MCS3467078.1 hypothetical protein [Pseudomonas sp. JUb42]
MTTIALYFFNSDLIFTESGSMEETDPIPMNSTFTAPPALTGTEVAKWNGFGVGWSVLPKYPDPYIPPPPIITPEEVDTERDRRIDAGFTFKGKVIQSRASDRENVSGAAQLAFMAIVGGAQPEDYRWSDPDAPFQWISADNSLLSLDAADTVAMGRAAAATKQSLIFKARDLKNMSPIPLDYTDDKWW